jgi:hypothetical protein
MTDTEPIGRNAWGWETGADRGAGGAAGLTKAIAAVEITPTAAIA